MSKENSEGSQTLYSRLASSGLLKLIVFIVLIQERRDIIASISSESLIKGFVFVSFHQVFEDLYKHYGEQQWWPAESSFEVMVGAILTQNTAWVNVEKAISNLKQANILSPQGIINTDISTLAESLRPSGYFNVKAKRLISFCSWYVQQGEFDVLAAIATADLRKALLSVHGVGEETADDILLYAFDRPVFVVDAYTKRLFSRLGLLDGDANYHTVQSVFHENLQRDVTLFNEYHALIVIHCKDVCRKKPHCKSCCLRQVCQFS